MIANYHLDSSVGKVPTTTIAHVARDSQNRSSHVMKDASTARAKSQFSVVSKFTDNSIGNVPIATFEHEKLKSDLALSQRENQELKADIQKLRNDLTAMEELRKEEAQSHKTQCATLHRDFQAKLSEDALQAKTRAETDKKKMSEELFVVRGKYDEALNDIKQLKKLHKSLEDRMTFLSHRGGYTTAPETLTSTPPQKSAPPLVKPLISKSNVWPPLTTAQEQQLLSARSSKPAVEPIAHINTAKSTPTKPSAPFHSLPPSPGGDIYINQASTLRDKERVDEKMFSFDQIKVLTEMLLSAQRPTPAAREFTHNREANSHPVVKNVDVPPTFVEDRKEKHPPLPTKAIQNMKLISLLEEQLGQANQQRDEIKDKLSKYENMPRIKSAADKARKDALIAMLVELESEVSELRKELRANAALLP
eukprot:GDKK01024598.1.p1 GENE.GDKK01024598.1~~GDKK01024598.1.p1  ORF type:complete len:486 (+),score=43.22 GDKK01024598.1:198-1460(+)